MQLEELVGLGDAEGLVEVQEDLDAEARGALRDGIQHLAAAAQWLGANFSRDPGIAGGVSANSRLRADAEAAGVRAGMPVGIISAPQAGATSPVTLAGTIVQTLADAQADVAVDFTVVDAARENRPRLAFDRLRDRDSVGKLFNEYRAIP